MSEDRKPKQLLKTRAEGKRSRGRSKIEWEDYMGQRQEEKGKICKK
jgi:hypothetical protein